MKHIILLPTYNERVNVCSIIPLIFSTLPNIQVMVIDDNSPDGTAEAVRQMQKMYPRLSLYQRPKKEGLGQAYIDAFQKVLRDTNIEVICTMDADLSHNPKYLPTMLTKCQTNDVIIGSRYVPGGSVAGWERWRKFLSRWGNRYVRVITGVPIHDFTSGFICLRADVLRQIDFSHFDTSGYAFLIYLKFKLWKLGVHITEMPICFKNRLTGESKISINIIQEGLLLPWKLLRKRETQRTTPKCPSCRNDATAYWFTKNTCDVYRCASCGLIFIYPVPRSSIDVYGPEYFCGAGHGFGYINYDEDKRTDTNTFTVYLDHIERILPYKGTLLDVGAATGLFVGTAVQRGWQGQGLEISDFAATEGRKKGLSIITGTLKTASFIEHSFDVITLLDVFEHIADPHETLQMLSRLLKPHGLIALNMPDAGSWYARLMGRRWQLIIPPEHLRLYNFKNLSWLLEQYGFTTIEQTRIGKNYTLAYIFQILYTIRHQTFWKKLSAAVLDTALNSLRIPINLHDNMFVIARLKD